MNFKIAPRFIIKIIDSYVLWFEASNQYIVVSETIKDLLDVFFKTSSKSSFLEALQLLNIPLKKAEAFYVDLQRLVENANHVATPSSGAGSIPIVPATTIFHHYEFSNTVVRVHYGSRDIENLIHPQWSHAVINGSTQPQTNFTIFAEGDQLFLFRHDTFVGSYPKAEYHFLQGQFALELVNTFYTKTESDWIATFHASTVCNANEAIMIIGASGNGKSTLSAVLMASGIDVLADDFTPLSAVNGEVYRYPSGISVKEGAFEMLETLYPDFHNYPLYVSTSKGVNIKYIPPIRPMDTSASHLPCKKIVYVKYDPNAPSRLQKVSTEKILETLIPESWLSPLASNAELFLEWIKNLQCYELTYSDNAVAVSKFNELFRA
ncbi:hypothetical protein MWU76_04600 [Gelidibacter sp. F2691]|nr:hypothetical protein [Gelidibacter sp. F2691]